MNKTVIFPGSFDPLTHGHIQLINRATQLFSSVVVGVAKDTTGRSPFFPYETRLQLVKESLRGFSGVTVKGFSGLLVAFYEAESACAVIRGLRHAQDFEYERQLFYVNQQLLGHLETIFLASAPGEACISASMVREIARLGGDVSAFVPSPVLALIEKHGR